MRGAFESWHGFQITNQQPLFRSAGAGKWHGSTCIRLIWAEAMEFPPLVASPME